MEMVGYSRVAVKQQNDDCPTFICPQCGTAVAVVESRMNCGACGWTTSAASGHNFLINDELPSFDWKSKEVYRDICNGGGPAQPWACDRLATRAGQELHRTQVETVLRHKPSVAGTLVDISAGCGLHLADLAQHFGHVVHWEAHQPSVLHAINAYRERRLSNVTVCRGSYLFPLIVPASMDMVVSFDTFERGIEHDELLLRNIRELLKPNGIAIMDFHARGASNSGVRAYDAQAVRIMAKTSGLQVVELVSAGFGPTTRFRQNALLWNVARTSAKLCGVSARKIAVLRRLPTAQRSSYTAKSRMLAAVLSSAG